MWELDRKEGWTPKNWCFCTGLLEIFESPLDLRRSNQSILMEINPEYPLEGLMLKLKPQYFGHLMQRTNSLEKTWCWERLKAGGEGGNRIRWFDGITNSVEEFEQTIGCKKVKRGRKEGREGRRNEKENRKSGQHWMKREGDMLNQQSAI